MVLLKTKIVLVFHIKQLVLVWFLAAFFFFAKFHTNEKNNNNTNIL
jgi:hypothetical protein